MQILETTVFLSQASQELLAIHQSHSLIHGLDFKWTIKQRRVGLGENARLSHQKCLSFNPVRVGPNLFSLSVPQSPHLHVGAVTLTYLIWCVVMIVD